jgi:probable phosphoglycerate mutase
MDIVLIRHGETAWNAERRLQGHIDIGLNDEGMRQVAALGQALAQEPFDAIFASDLQRALQTAEALIVTRTMPIVIDAGLRERCYGAFEGMLYDDIAPRYPQAHAAWMAGEVDARFPQGEFVAETLNEFHARANSTMRKIIASGAYRKIAIVSHGGVLDCVFRAINDVHIGATREFDVLNASINRLHWDGRQLQIREWGNVAHLRAPALDELAR